MSRPALPFASGDISALARALERQIAAHDGPPGHVEMLNMLARAGGFATGATAPALPWRRVPPLHAGLRAARARHASPNARNVAR